ncbi:protein-methionine-sulfoxide reductase catalytic subunit MsrP [Shewanella sp. NFH-SH190041]|uniref:protein-methionine-sulfoxide reductase catalytic subunit MsrP n=1 Tax=Shewanella sp. NFH-SH190041 TaxID=2950245 RepID=UPI0021C3420E|nr:protein-methionine-sulfoxide reductase catalytic subunit MsrP [Shewanella sp. NFH-SH190041]BDM64063.1 protein-methionine-sulfoxide reductase catalytic subunit MsrP [Shewanella sp. NFH-SH190041]
MSRHFIRGIRRSARWQLDENQATSESVFRARRQILQSIGLGTIAASLPGAVQAGLFDLFGEQSGSEFKTQPLSYTQPPKFAVGDQSLTPYQKVTTHNNFYEFGTDKDDPAKNAQKMQVDPWHLSISGEVERPVTLDYDDLFNFALEERVYRLRCVEAWSMVIPWVGFPLSRLLHHVGVKSNAKFVAFETVFDPTQMPGQRNALFGGGIHYPYVEGLTLPEAMNELTFIAVGLYGKTLPPQNGAPVRLVVPWKYGFKSIKSIVSIKLTHTQPPTSWQQIAPHEYGFYANVNPSVDHPRWSQASERRIGPGGLFSATRIPTQLFNGYGPEVAYLYKNLDLKKAF